MRIDEFEFQDRNGNEIEPTKNQLVVYIKSLHKQIAELKKQLERHNKYFNSFSCDSFDEFADFISTFMLTPHEEQTLIKDLKKQLKEKEKYTYTGKEVGEIERKYDEKIDTLEQQLKSQPAEIVEKIKEQLIKRLNTIAGYGRMTTDELSFLIETEFGSDLDTILKEYQK